MATPGCGRARSRLLEFQVAEIDAAELTDPDEDARLDEEEQRLADAVGIRDALRDAHDTLDVWVVDALGSAIAALGGRAPLAPLEARLRGCRPMHPTSRTSSSRPTTTWSTTPSGSTRSAFGGSCSATSAASTAPTSPRSWPSGPRPPPASTTLRGHDARVVAELEAGRDATRSRLDRAAGELRAVRLAAAEPFAAAVSAELAALAMPGAWIGVEVTPAEPGEDGADDVTMMLAANPGEPPNPLAKVASGGELARALLAVRVATVGRERPDPAGGAGTPASGGRMLVFDEVDAGIGGEAGAAVGRALAELARDAQVLCVTHLAQVAACARTQVVVRKGDRGGRTVARAEVVGGEHRVTELSRMLAGVESSDHACRHAEELLGRADAERGRRGMSDAGS